MSVTTAPRLSATTRFVAVATVCSAVFWLLGWIVRAELLVAGLPVSAGMFVAPAIAAWLVRSELPAAQRSPILPHGRTALSLAAWTAVMPALLASSYLAMLLAGQDVPPVTGVSPLAVAGLSLVFLISSACEEVGWTRFLSYRLLDRLPVVRIGISVGAIWAALHLIPYLQAGRSWEWIAWQCAFTIVFRVLIVAAVARPGSGWWTAVALHASYDVGWALFPIGGSHYDPRTTAILTAIAAALAVRWSGSPLRVS